jgi:RNA polymerase sigma-B factor
VTAEVHAPATLRTSDSADSAARRQLIEAHLPLVRRIAGRFTGRGERLEDLVQVGVIGLIGAIDRCDPERASELTAYVARCVEGEIRRHLRDRCAVVRIPRRVQEDHVLATLARTYLPLGEERPGSIGPGDSHDDQWIARAMVTSAVKSLDGRERRVIVLRYFGDLSQSEIGCVVGVSQVHVSRLLSGAIAKMRARLAPVAEGADDASH